MSEFTVLGIIQYKNVVISLALAYHTKSDRAGIYASLQGQRLPHGVIICWGLIPFVA